MSFRNNMRRNDRNNFGNNYGNMNRNVNPWDNGMGGRQGGGGGGMMNQGFNADALSLANDLISNLLRNQGGQVPSLLDLPNNNMRGGGGYGGGMGGRSIGNRSGGNNINRNRRQGGNGGGGNGGARKGGVRKPNSKDRAKNVLAKNSVKTDSSADNAKSKNDSDSNENGQQSRKNKRRESPYMDIPNDLFYCHMCMKHMWDSTSFENHIKGRSHQMMKEGIEESYRLRANMIRQEAKIMEQLKGIEIDRMKRLGKNLKASNQHRDYCTMCDLHFYGNLTNHRKTDGHVNLKKFLHPRCTDCAIEYPNRTDFDDHLLSPEHMAKISKKASRFDKTKKNQLQILTENDELSGLKPEKEKKPKPKVTKDADKSVEGGDKTVEGEDGVKVEPMETENGENGEEEAVESEIKEEPAPIEEAEDVILDFIDGQIIPVEVDPKIPKYNHLRPLANSMIAKLECYECRLCGRFFDTEKTAEIHSRTIYHYRQFVKFLNEKANETKIAQRRAEAAAEEEERRKRQKLEDEAEMNGNNEKMDESGGGDLYDPSEATGDDEDKANESTASAVAEEHNGTNGSIKTEPEKEEPTAEADVTIEEISVAPAETEAPAAEPEKKEEEVPAVVEETKPAVVNTPQTPRQQPARNQNNRSGGNRSRGRGRYNRY